MQYSIGKQIRVGGFRLPCDTISGTFIYIVIGIVVSLCLRNLCSIIRI